MKIVEQSSSQLKVVHRPVLIWGLCALMMALSFFPDGDTQSERLLFSGFLFIGSLIALYATGGIEITTFDKQRGQVTKQTLRLIGRQTVQFPLREISRVLVRQQRNRRNGIYIYRLELERSNHKIIRLSLYGVYSRASVSAIAQAICQFLQLPTYQFIESRHHSVFSWLTGYK